MITTAPNVAKLSIPFVKATLPPATTDRHGTISCHSDNNKLFYCVATTSEGQVLRFIGTLSNGKVSFHKFQAEE